MSFLAPWWLALSAALAGVVVVLHLLARRRPRLLYFPTARFIPDRPASAASLASRPTDLIVLLLRVLLLLLLGAAFAQPVTSPPRRTTQIVLLDRSRLGPSLDSTSAQVISAADLVIAFDSAVRTIERDSAGAVNSSGARGSLSVALIAALKAATDIAGRGDSFALTIISPFAMEEFDQATLTIRRQWKGSISLLPVPAALPAILPNRVDLAPDDPLAASLALLKPDHELPSRIIRERAGPGDSAWATDGGALVIWPRKLEEAGWAPGPGDSIGGVAVDQHAVVATFPREFAPPEGEIAAVWADGAVAATSAPLGRGCMRSIAIAIPEAGDLVLRESFLQLTRAVLSPCSGWFQPEPASAALLDSLRGSPALAPSVAFAAVERKTPANRWLLLGAAFLFALEPLVRRRKSPR